MPNDFTTVVECKCEAKIKFLHDSWKKQRGQRPRRS